MEMRMDKDTQRAWHGWVNFTNAIAISVVAAAAITAFVIFLLL